MSKLVRVVRLIAYEGPEEVVDRHLAQAKAEGRHDFGAMEMTVVTVETNIFQEAVWTYNNNKDWIDKKFEQAPRIAPTIIPGTSTLMVQWAKGDPLIVSTRLHPKHGVIGNFERYSDTEGFVWIKLKGLMGLTELEAWQISRYDKESS